MPDGRRNNGGNSTKAKGIDKRKNPYKAALQEAITIEQFTELIRTVAFAAANGDMRAARLMFEYYLGKPDQAIKLETPQGISINPVQWLNGNEKP